MPSTPIAGFVTKIEAAEQYQRSHRQLTRDLSDAMKAQNSKVLDNARLHTEDGTIIEGMGITPEIIDQLCIEGKNPTWYLRSTWLEKAYGRRGGTGHHDRARPDAIVTDGEQGSVTPSRPGLEEILRERIRDLERDKDDLREEMKIKNQQIADRVERERETNALIRDLHTLMADLQRRLLPPPAETPPSQITAGRAEPRAPKSAPRDEVAATEAEVIPTAKTPEKGSRRPGMPSRPPAKQRPSRKHTRRATDIKKPVTTKNETPASDTSKATKSRSLWSRLFSH